MSQSMPADVKSLPGPDDVTRVSFPMGSRVLTRSNFDSPSVVVSGYLPAGSIFDPREKLGLAHFTCAGLDARNPAGAVSRKFSMRWNRLGLRWVLAPACTISVLGAAR